MMAPYPSPIADSIERCAQAMTAPRVLENPDYAAEWAMNLHHCAAMVRAMEMPEPKKPRYLPLETLAYWAAGTYSSAGILMLVYWIATHH